MSWWGSVPTRPRGFVCACGASSTSDEPIRPKGGGSGSKPREDRVWSHTRSLRRMPPLTPSPSRSVEPSGDPGGHEAERSGGRIPPSDGAGKGDVRGYGKGGRRDVRKTYGLNRKGTPLTRIETRGGGVDRSEGKENPPIESSGLDAGNEGTDVGHNRK